MIFSKLFSKKVTVNLYEKGFGWRKIKGKITYDRDIKKWFLEFEKERLPVTEKIFSSVFNNEIIVIRYGPNSYSILEIYPDKKEPKEESYIKSEDIYEALTKAQLRYERLKSPIERFLPVVMIGIALIFVGIFIAIVWSSTGQQLNQISANFKDAMNVLQNITTTQLEILKQIKGVEVVPAR